MCRGFICVKDLYLIEDLYFKGSLYVYKWVFDIYQRSIFLVLIYNKIPGAVAARVKSLKRLYKAGSLKGSSRTYQGISKRNHKIMNRNKRT